MEVDIPDEYVVEFWSETSWGRDIRKLGFGEGEAKGRAESVAQMLTVLLHRRFGDDTRITAIAERLANSLDPTDAMDRIDEADDLDQLA